MGSATTQGKLWSASAEDWTYIQENQQKTLFEKMLEVSKVGEQTRILDAGCGGGSASLLAENLNAIVTGIDASPAIVKVANNRVKRGIFQVGDIELLPFVDESFDVVLASNCLQFSENKVNTLKEFKRVITSEGKIVISLFSSPDRVNYSSVLKAMGSVIPEGKRGGDNPFALSDLNKLKDLVQQAGLKVIENGEINVPYEYNNFETFWKSIRSLGPAQNIVNIVGVAKLKETLKSGLTSFTEGNGMIKIPNNNFLYLLLSKS